MYTDHVEAKNLLAAYGLPVVRAHLVGSEEEAVSKARELTFPVVLKIASGKIVHKNDAGGVILGIGDEAELVKSFRHLDTLRRDLDPESRITVEKMALPGVELFVGAINDESYGKVVLFGVGGIFVEIYGDVVYRLAPLKERDAREMLEELKGRRILDGIRGYPPVDRDGMVDFLLKFSFFAENEDFLETDVNPVICRGDAIYAVDARIVKR